LKQFVDKDEAFANEVEALNNRVVRDAVYDSVRNKMLPAFSQQLETLCGKKL
jgi:hypothetical protein